MVIRLSQLLALYAGVGIGIAVATVAFQPVCQAIERIGARVGMTPGYARLVWITGTVLAWPVGLYARMTGKLVLAPHGDADRPAHPSLDAALAAFRDRLSGQGVRALPVPGTEERYVFDVAREQLEDALAAALRTQRRFDPSSRTISLKTGPRRFVANPGEGTPPPAQ